MPNQLHQKLEKAAKEAGLEPGSESYKAYVYGTLNEVKDSGNN